MRSPASLRAKLPPLHAVQAFEAVARNGSVGTAAIELGVSSGAVSQQLRKIEACLCLRLLERRGKGLELTSWGRLYQAELAPAFEQLRRAQDRLLRAQTASGLVLSCLSSVASRWIGPRLFDWLGLHPGARVRLVGAEAEPSLSRGDVDFRISYGDAGRLFQHTEPLFSDALVPACAPSLLAAYPVRKPADLLKLPLISIEWDAMHGGQPGWSDWALHIGAVRPAPAGELAFSLSSAAIDAAVTGRGVVLAQVSMIADDLASGRLVVPFDQRLRLPQHYFLAWDRAALQKPYGAEFRDWLVALGQGQAQDADGPLHAPVLPVAERARLRVRSRSARA